ncbi:glycoside hydrolase family 3 C-terminal domain-containing protein [Fusibacter bizertensis]|uniref:Glycoside hydrolase family 3 C-terminal domain-containing protein n=1 Tax=Fusibacter bizertensis TaxID=1488331 RepID=A0ABT6NHF0_9FIRM|nr:glycoside hydrolase family 3 C-terminal domain-containing protein [Fusibacter bizertensis]MDH8679867.1 glycoside hydrolase family 3 C-terminal domain-containing protein [Fusibacter bizertensis]
MKRSKSRFWTGLSSFFALFLCLSIIGTNLAFDYASTINGALKIQTSKIVNIEGEAEDTIYYKSEYGEINGENLKKLIEDTHEQGVLEAEEGMVLLRNEDYALPLDSSEVNVTLFGHAVVQPLYRNKSAGSNAYETEDGVDLYEALSKAGFKINDQLFSAYKESSTKRGVAGFNFRTQETSEWSFGEENISFYTDELKNSWESNYNDVAIVMLAREGGEGNELFMEDPEEGISQLALHKTESDLLKMIQESGKFKKTIVLINSGNPMELGWLDEYDVDAALWIGCPGTKGFEAVASILKGETNPSGRLVETYAVNSLSSPAVTNNSYNAPIWSNFEDVVEKLTDSPEQASTYAVQSEGIYIGYKYYETRYEDSILNRFNASSSTGSSDGNDWEYKNEVTFPFGFGLSYTSFDQKIDKVTVNEDTVSVDVTVTNTGELPGKSVVQIYAQTPYGDYEQENLVEKAAIQLLDFGKTDILAPGESQSLTIDCDKYLLASYDYVNVKGYILSEGDYYVALGDNVHDALNNILSKKGATNMYDINGVDTSGDSVKAYKWQENFDDSKYALSAETNVVVTNQFEDCDINYWVDDKTTYLSRSDWQGTYPSEAVKVALNEDMISQLNGGFYKKPEGALSISDYTQGENQDIQLVTLRGVDKDDPLWERYLNQMTIEEMASLIANTFGTKEIPSLGVPASPAGDGPDGIGGSISSFSEEKYGFTSPTACYTNESILASSFNRDLIARRGELMGEEGLFLGIVEIWGPGVNLHRTPFGGRNFEYYSEDANMNYLCSIPFVEALEEKGVHAGAKHVTANDQENSREGISVFFNEQALREGALRGAEGAIAKAGGNSAMQAFNRLGLVGSFAKDALNIQVMRNEWGFNGHIETDAIAGAEEGYKSHYETMLASGTDSFCLDFPGMSSVVITESIRANDDGELLGHLRRAAHNILYNISNSNVVNGQSVTSRVVSLTPWWQPTFFGLIALFSVLELLSLLFLFKSKQSNKQVKSEVTL